MRVHRGGPRVLTEAQVRYARLCRERREQVMADLKTIPTQKELGKMWGVSSVCVYHAAVGHNYGDVD